MSDPHNQPDEWLSEKDLAAITGKAPCTLASERSRGAFSIRLTTGSDRKSAIAVARSRRGWRPVAACPQPPSSPRRPDSRTGHPPVRVSASTYQNAGHLSRVRSGVPAHCQSISL
jgi:hypothetical protein